MDTTRPEQWRPVDGYEGVYEVSSLGRVRNLDRVVEYADGRRRRYPGIILQLQERDDGHLDVALFSGPRKRVVRRVHTLVLTAFIGPRPHPDWHSRHLNGNPLDNRVENLAWGTRSENTFDMVKHGVHNHARKTHCKSGHSFDGVRMYPDGRTARTCSACREASREKARKKKERDRGNAQLH